MNLKITVIEVPPENISTTRFINIVKKELR
jgi:hypothetical protein